MLLIPHDGGFFRRIAVAKWLWFLAVLAAAGCTSDYYLERVQALHREFRDHKPHEVYVYGLAQGEFAAGSTGAFRVVIKRPVALDESVPIPAAEVSVKVADEVVYSGKTDARGEADVRFRVPDAGPALGIEVDTKSSYGQQDLSFSMQVKKREKVLLVTDKPIYQPGQVIHMRGLCLDQTTLKPMAEREFLWEVLDSKGNKVFKKRVRTDEYGIVWADFPLADEVNTGEYSVCAVLDEATAEKKTVVVDKYALPKFKVAVTADKSYFSPGELVKCLVEADYLFGKPVAAGTVKVSAATFDVEFKDFEKIEGVTGADGSFTCEFRIPDYLVGQPLDEGNGILKIAAEVTDQASHTEKRTVTFPVARDSLQIKVIVEGGRVVSGVSQKFYMLVGYPDGTPARARVGMELKGKRTWDEVETDETGVATIPVLIRPEELNFSQAMYYENRYFLGFLVTARDDRGNTARAEIDLPTHVSGQSFLLRADKAIYRGGDTVNLEILSTFDAGDVYVDVVKGRQTMLTRTVEVVRGRGTASFTASPEIFGVLQCHAYKLQRDGQYVRDTRTVYVHPVSDVRIAVNPDKPVYRPGEEAKIKFYTTDGEGRPVPAALGVSIVDEAVYALSEMQPGLEKMYFTLQRELMEPRYQIRYGPGGDIRNILRDTGGDRSAMLVFAQYQAEDYPLGPNYQLAQRQECLDIQLARIFAKTVEYLREHAVSHRHADGHWGLRSDLLEQLAKKGSLNPKMLEDPLRNGRFTWQMLEKADPSFSYEMLGRLETARKIRQIRRTLTKTGVRLPPGDLSGLADEDITDAWGSRIRSGADTDGKISVVSAGPDRQFDTADDVLSENLSAEGIALAKSGRNWACRSLRNYGFYYRED